MMQDEKVTDDDFEDLDFEDLDTDDDFEDESWDDFDDVDSTENSETVSEGPSEEGQGPAKKKSFIQKNFNLIVILIAVLGGGGIYLFSVWWCS